MPFRFFFVFIILVAFILPPGCEKKKESEKKEIGKKAPGGFIVNFKPNDVPDLLPKNSFYIQQESAQVVGGQPKPVKADAQNAFCLDILAKEIGPTREIRFELTHNPEYIRYLDYKTGVLFEKRGKATYKVEAPADQKGRLAVLISGEGEAGSSGKILTVCFQALRPSRADVLFEKGELMDPQGKKAKEVNWVGGLLWILETD